MGSKPGPQLWWQALSGIPWLDAPTWRVIHPILRWLIAARASVLPLTLFAVLFALCLAQPATLHEWLVAGCCLFALLLAHATNNLINDYVDHATGVDQDNYFRTQYGVHVLAAGLVSAAHYQRYILVTGSAALGIGIGVCLVSGGVTYVFALAGAFLVLFYTYPLKRLGLGEIAVLLAWGPLMIAGVYAATKGMVSTGIVWAGVVYGLGPTVVIFAKHTDKADFDRDKGVLTLPVLMGTAAARTTTKMLVTLQFVMALGVGFYYSWLGLVAITLAVPSAWRLWRVLGQPIPVSRPEDYPASAWPLWYTTHAFVYARNAGLWLTLGVLLEGIVAA